jgi:hypothetical protein
MQISCGIFSPRYTSGMSRIRGTSFPASACSLPEFRIDLARKIKRRRKREREREDASSVIFERETP